MNYCTQADIELLIDAKEIARLTDDAGGRVVNQQVVDDAISRSGALIDAYCAGRYLVPFALPCPAIIKDLCAVLAAYELQARRPQTMPEEWRKRREDTTKTLLLISNGSVLLPGAATVSGTPAVASVGSFSANKRLFTRDDYDNA